MRIVLCAVVMAAVCGCGDDSAVTRPRAPVAQVVTAPHYRIDKLPTLGGRSQGGGINNSGRVAGYSGLPDGTRHAALWINGAVTDLGTLDGSRVGLHSPRARDL